MPGRLMLVPDSRDQILEKKGAKSKSVTLRKMKFIGSQSRSFSDVVSENLVTPGSLVLGSRYLRAEYEPTPGSRERVYEAVYGNSDFSNAVSANPGLRGQLDIIFGNKPSTDNNQLTEANLSNILGLSKAVPNQPGLSERRRSLVRAQNGISITQDDESGGIRGVGADDAPIDPFA